MAKMTTAALESVLAANQHGATGALNGTIGHRRASLMAQYNGEAYGDEVDDRSRVVMTDIRDTIESIKPELMDIFYGGDSVVEFSPRGEDDVDGANQETEVCNYIFEQKNNGFMVLYAWFTDALMLKNGYIKRFWDERETIEIEEYDDITPEEAYKIITDIEADEGEVEIVERWGGPEVDEDMAEDMAMGVPQEPEPFGFKLRIKREINEYKIVPVPPDEIVVSPLWNSLSFDGCPFVAHRTTKTVTELIEMGFDRKQVESLPSISQKLSSEEATERFSGEKSFESSIQNTAELSMRDILIYENYIMVDRNGDGKAELLQVFTSDNGKILKRGRKLAIEEVRGVPFNAACPVPTPHKHYGVSVAELVEDLQRLRTVLVRQMVDNIVMGNNPDFVVDESSMTDSTYEDLAVTSSGGRTIRVRGGPAAGQFVQPPQTAQQSLAGIQYVDNLREERTGVTKYNQGMDSNSLNKTMGGLKAIMSASQKKVLLIARIFAETAVAPMFMDMHADLRAGPIKKIGLRLNNEWIDVDPRTWKERADMTINVGLGTGDRDVQFQRLASILGQQKEAAAMGFVGPENIHYTLKKMVELSGFKAVEKFFPDPANKQPEPQKQPPPDPAMMLAKVQMQTAQMQRDTKMAEVEIKKMEAETRRLDVMMKDHRERDLAAAKIEAEEAARFSERVDGEALVNGQN